MKTGVNPQDLLNDLHQTFTECLEIAKAKNKDYGAESDAFNNFTLVEKLGVTKAEIGIMTRMCDKFARMCRLTNQDPAVVNESLDDTILDLINYLAIYRAYIKK